MVIVNDVGRAYFCICKVEMLEVFILFIAMSARGLLENGNVRASQE